MTARKSKKSATVVKSAPTAAPAAAMPSHIELAKAQWNSASPNTQRGIIAGAALGVGALLGSIFG